MFSIQSLVSQCIISIFCVTLFSTEVMFGFGVVIVGLQKTWSFPKLAEEIYFVLGAHSDS